MSRPDPKLLVACGLALLPWLSVPAALQAAAAVAPLEFTAATWNLRLDTPDDGPNVWAHRRDAVRALVRYHGIELLGTQEGLMNQVNDIGAMPGFAWVGVGRDDGKDAGEHSAIFFSSARFGLLAHGDYWLSATPDVPSRSWDSRCCNRLATWAKLRERRSGREFFVFSVHFDHEAEVSRRESAKLMLRKIKEIAGETPTVILGDFNATPDSEPVRIMTSAMRDGRKESESPPYGARGHLQRLQVHCAARAAHRLRVPHAALARAQLCGTDRQRRGAIPF
jgi:endonuclease/exonuclease/phosphatase family metal-dependent hydrolase